MDSSSEYDDIEGERTEWIRWYCVDCGRPNGIETADVVDHVKKYDRGAFVHPFDLWG